MKTIVKIVIVLVVLLGCVNVSRALLAEYRFEDAVHDAMLFNPRMTDAEIVKMVLDTAADFDIPIEADGITVREQGPDVIVEMNYTSTITVIPGVFEKDWTFTPSASTRVLVGKRQR